jgi:hypothetical protein
VQPLEHVVLIVRHARRIAEEQAEQNERVRRQCGHLAQCLIERQVVEPRDPHAVRERFDSVAKGLRPEPLERGGADHDGDVICIGRQLENVVEQA